MKKLQTLVLVAAVAASPLAFAAEGTTPKCMSGKFNIALVNKDVECNPKNIDTEGYCLYGLYITEPTDKSGFPIAQTCEEDAINLYQNMHQSYSYDQIPSYFEIKHNSYHTGKKRDNVTKMFRFAYQNGVPVTNCQEVFGSDVKCQLETKPNSKGGVNVILTLSKNN